MLAGGRPASHVFLSTHTGFLERIEIEKKKKKELHKISIPKIKIIFKIDARYMYRTKTLGLLVKMFLNDLKVSL
jgi:hypothetical protein